MSNTQSTMNDKTREITIFANGKKKVVPQGFKLVDIHQPAQSSDDIVIHDGLLPPGTYGNPNLTQGPILGF